SAPPAVTWDDVIAEARKAPALSVPALGSVNVDIAGHEVDPRDMMLDGLDALDAGTRTSAITSLLPLGSALDDVLRERFPGRILVDPFSPEQSLPPLAECSGLLALLVQRGLDGIPVALKHLDSPDRMQRLFAVYMLLVITYPQALESLSRRLYDTEPRVRFLAADALRSYTREPGYTRILQSLREQLKVPVYEVQVTTVQVLGQLRDPRAVPSLIPLVVSPQPELASAAASALAVICAQAFGRDVARWAEWWQASYNRPRETWLVASLRHPSPQVQRIAFSELQLLTGYTGTFDPMASVDVREPVVRVWEKWLDDLVHIHNQPENRVSA
ncbi:MAG: HEAT repeat domain-containing protein, partial [Clostridia bacterium]|nr:HEAT repeat domain-containing protein [Deltaproteobacteria bacterium]